jgi:RimJ/RimL family protein N-acetyltransferase
MSHPHVFVTERIAFRRWRERDLELAVALWGHRDVARFIAPGGVFSRAAIEARLNEEIANEHTHGFSYWPMFLREGGDFVGCCGLRPHGPDIPELGVHLLPQFWGRGLAHEAARRVIDHAFGQLAAKALVAGHGPDNAASQALLLRLGFRWTHDELYAPTGLPHPSYVLERPDPVRRLVDLWFLCALRKGAAAFMLEPSADGLQLFLLIDGEMQLEMKPPKALHGRIVDTLRRMAAITPETDEREAGRVHLRIGDTRVEAFEVKVLPTELGARLVVDVLGTVRDFTVV